MWCRLGRERSGGKTRKKGKKGKKRKREKEAGTCRVVGGLFFKTKEEANQHLQEVMVDEGGRWG